VYSGDSFGPNVKKYLVLCENDEVRIVETDSGLRITFVIDRQFTIISSNKLDVVDIKGTRSCTVSTCNACDLKKEKRYLSNVPLKNWLPFLCKPDSSKPDSNKDDLKNKLIGCRGIFDLFYHDGKFAISLYIKKRMERIVFYGAQEVFSPGCDPAIAPKSHFDLNEHRQALFQTTDCQFQVTEFIKDSASGGFRMPIDPCSN
jgi:hypothetical protein